MLLIINYLLIITGLVKRKNKIISVFMLLFMWVLFGWSRNVADQRIYQTRYLFLEEYEAMTEPIFTFIFSIGYFFEMTYLDLLPFLSLAILAVLYFVTYRLTNQVSIVMALILIFPFTIQACWIRLSLAMIFMYIAFYFSLRETKKSILLYYLFSVLGIFTHLGVFPLLSFIWLKKMSIRRVFYGMIVSSLLFMMTANVDSILSLLSFIISEGKAISVQNSYSLGKVNISNLYRIASLILLGSISVFLLFKQRNFFRRMEEGETDKKQNVYLFRTEYMIKINLAIMSLAPLILLFDDFYRLQVYIFPLNYIVLSYRFCFSRKLGFVWLTAFYAFIAFYITVGRLDMVDMTFWAFFVENSLLN